MSLYEQIHNEKPLLDYCNEYPPLGDALIKELKKTEYITNLRLGVVWELQGIYKLDYSKSFVFTYLEIFEPQF